MYKVTLSMPIYNVAPYVERALLSALNQTFDSIEFLLVDDRGTDNSMENVRRIIKDHPRGKDVRIIEHPHNIGTGATKNTAIDNAQGEYLFFMDSDDEITQDCIEILYNKMIESKCDVVFSSYDNMDSDGVIIKHYIYNDFYLNTNSEIIHYKYIQKKYMAISLWNKLYRSSFVKDNNIYCKPDHLSEDQFFTYQILLKADRIRLVSDVTYKYFTYKNSIIGQINSGLINSKRAKEYINIIDLKYLMMKDYMKKYPCLITSLITETIFYSSLIENSILLNSRERKRYVQEIMDHKYNILNIQNLSGNLILTMLLVLFINTPLCFKRLVIYMFYNKRIR